MKYTKQDKIQELIEQLQDQSFPWRPGQEVEVFEISNPIPICHPLKADMNLFGHPGNPANSNFIEFRIFKTKTKPEIYPLIKELDEKKSQEFSKGISIEVLPFLRIADVKNIPIVFTFLWFRIKDKVKKNCHFEFITLDSIPGANLLGAKTTEENLSRETIFEVFENCQYQEYLSDLIVNITEVFPKIIGDIAEWSGYSQTDSMIHSTVARWACFWGKSNKKIGNGSLTKNKKELNRITNFAFSLTDFHVGKYLVEEGLIKRNELDIENLPVGDLIVFENFNLDLSNSSSEYLNKILDQMMNQFGTEFNSGHFH